MMLLALIILGIFVAFSVFTLSFYVWTLFRHEKMLTYVLMGFIAEHTKDNENLKFDICYRTKIFYRHENTVARTDDFNFANRVANLAYLHADISVVYMKNRVTGKKIHLRRNNDV